jgi:Exonuclease VII, large subunit
MNTAERRVYTVSELTASIKTTLEEGFPMMWVEGEISNLRTPGSGHAYFTLKDEGAQISAVLFRGRGRRVRFELEDGMQVLAFGGLDVYAARGQYQLVVEMMEPKGWARSSSPSSSSSASWRRKGSSRRHASDPSPRSRG